MALETILQQETKGLSDETLKDIIRYVRFLKLDIAKNSQIQLDSNIEKKKFRNAGKYHGMGWMANDFDAPIEEFKEYM